MCEMRSDVAGLKADMTSAKADIADTRKELHDHRLLLPALGEPRSRP